MQEKSSSFRRASNSQQSDSQKPAPQEQSGEEANKFVDTDAVEDYEKNRFRNHWMLLNNLVVDLTVNGTDHFSKESKLFIARKLRNLADALEN